MNCPAKSNLKSRARSGGSNSVENCCHHTVGPRSTEETGHRRGLRTWTDGRTLKSLNLLVPRFGGRHSPLSAMCGIGTEAEIWQYHTVGTGAAPAPSDA